MSVVRICDKCFVTRRGQHTREHALATRRCQDMDLELDTAPSENVHAQNEEMLGLESECARIRVEMERINRALCEEQTIKDEARAQIAKLSAALEEGIHACLGLTCKAHCVPCF